MKKNTTNESQYLKTIPSLKTIPEAERKAVFKEAFKNKGYRFFLGFVAVLFIVVFYFNLDAILQYEKLESGGIIARNTHFLKELGVRFFLPVLMVFLILVLGRNYFVRKQVEKFLKSKR